MTPPAPATRRSRRGKLPTPLALKYFTRGALLEALEARGWRQLAASGLHTWMYFTPEGLKRRANKEPTVRNVDFVLDDDGLYAYVELHGILDELIREKEAAETEDATEPDRGGNDAPRQRSASPPTGSQRNGRAVRTSASSVQSMGSAESEHEDRSFIPTSDDEDEDEDADEQSSGAQDLPPPTRKRPRLRTARSNGKKSLGRVRGDSASASCPTSPRRGRNGNALLSSSSPDTACNSEDDSAKGRAARAEREYVTGKETLRRLEAELEVLEQRVKRQRFRVRKLRIERNCQRQLRALEEQFFDRDTVKKEPGIDECD